MPVAPRLVRSTIPLLLSAALPSGCGSDQAGDGSGSDAADALPAVQSELCAIEIVCDEDIPDDPKIDCALVVTEATGTTYDGPIGIERRGRSSLQYDKPNYGFELRANDGANNPTNLMGMGEDEDWQLDGSWVDRSFVRNQLVDDLFASFGAQRFAPEGRYCTLALNDEYQGIYRLVERIKRGPARINLPADDGSGETFVIQQDPDGALRFNLGLEDSWDTIYPKEPTNTQRAGAQRFLDELDEALERRDDDPAQGVFSVLDQGNIVDWIIIQELSRNVDAYKLSVHLYRSKGNNAHLVPWDFDLSMGQPTVTSNAAEPRGGDQSAGWNLERTDFIQDVLAVPGLPQSVATRWRELRQTALATDRVLGRVDAYAALLAPSVEENFERWPLEDVRFEPIYPPYSLYRVTSYSDEITKLETWLRERLTWIDDNVDDFEAGSNSR